MLNIVGIRLISSISTSQPNPSNGDWFTIYFSIRFWQNYTLKSIFLSITPVTPTTHVSHVCFFYTPRHWQTVPFRLTYSRRAADESTIFPQPKKKGFKSLSSEPNNGIATQDTSIVSRQRRRGIILSAPSGSSSNSYRNGGNVPTVEFREATKKKTLAYRERRVAFVFN